MDKHNWSNGHTCTCGSDLVVCQGCGKLVCGAVTVRADTCTVVRTTAKGNVAPCCFHKFGLGHSGPTENK